MWALSGPGNRLSPHRHEDSGRLPQSKQGFMKFHCRNHLPSFLWPAEWKLPAPWAPHPCHHSTVYPSWVPIADHYSSVWSCFISCKTTFSLWERHQSSVCSISVFIQKWNHLFKSKKYQEYSSVQIYFLIKNNPKYENFILFTHTRNSSSPA